MYLLGKTIEKRFFSNSYSPNLRLFVRITLGYIFLSTTIFLLGLFSLLTPLTVVITLCLGVIISIFEFIRKPIRPTLHKDFFKLDTLKTISILIILASFLRLLPPEPAGDPLDYHLLFPKVYLYQQTMMIPPLGNEADTTVPHLSDILYIPSQVFTNGEASRIIHFGFFILMFFLLYSTNLVYKKEKNIGPIAAILFALNPLVFKISPYAFSDFPALLCLTLSGYVLFERKKLSQNILLSGILMGGALASKIWVLFYFPFYTLFLFLLLNKNKLFPRIKVVLIFISSALSIAILWYIRSYILIGNPFYISAGHGLTTEAYSLIDATLMQLNPDFLLHSKFLLNEESALVYLGMILIIFNFKKIYNLSDKRYLSLTLILFLSSFVVHSVFALGRYTLPYIIPLYTVSAFAIAILYKNILGKLITLLVFCLITMYYLFNSLIILPYGLGWANADSYLKRSLMTSSAGYYDFNHTFGRSIKPDELIAIYGVQELYYATFRYKNIYNFYNQKTQRLDIPTSEINKLLIRGGDFKWFCVKAKIINCREYKVTLITSFPSAQQYLYKIHKISTKK